MPDSKSKLNLLDNDPQRKTYSKPEQQFREMKQAEGQLLRHTFPLCVHFMRST
jgi:hypothetical protein